MKDPNKKELLTHIKTHPIYSEASEFDIEGAIYWVATHWHGGQDSELYKVLCNSPFEPGSGCSGPEKDSIELVYSNL